MSAVDWSYEIVRLSTFFQSVSRIPPSCMLPFNKDEKDLCRLVKMAPVVLTEVDPAETVTARFQAHSNKWQAEFFMIEGNVDNDGLSQVKETLDKDIIHPELRAWNAGQIDLARALMSDIEQNNADARIHNTVVQMINRPFIIQ